MPLLYPTITARRVTNITKNTLDKLGVKALLLDVDNTLTTHNHPEPREESLRWLDYMRRSGIELVLVSNNSEKRIKPFAEGLSARYMSRAAKPLPIGFARAARMLGLKPHETAIVGDQIFTDILGGNIFGAKTILVQPIEPEQGPFFRFKRKLEKKVLRRYRRSKEKGARGI